MGRLREAIEAGRQAVATREARTQAMLAIGLDEPSLVKVAKSRSEAARARGGRVILIADHLPAELVSASELVFEHLPQMADLLVAASPADAGEHRLRRLALILARWGVTECLWTGGEAEDLVRLALARTGPDRLPVAFRPQAVRPQGA
jgi:hypothetical protein